MTSDTNITPVSRLCYSDENHRVASSTFFVNLDISFFSPGGLVRRDYSLRTGDASSEECLLWQYYKCVSGQFLGAAGQ